MHLVCIKYELVYSYATSRDPFLFFNPASLSFLRYAHWDGATSLASGAGNCFGGKPPTCLLPAEDRNTLLLYPTGAWRARQKQKTNLPASTIRIQTPFCPSSTCAHPLLKDFIYLCAGLAPYRQLCTSKSLYLSFYNSILKLVCLLDVDPKEKKHLIK